MSRTEGDPSETLQAEVRLRDELISAASHDLRSPIGAINIFCEILRSNSKNLDESQLNTVRMIGEAAHKLQLILEDTMEIARIHSGRMTARISTVDFRESAQNALDQVRPIAEGRGLRISESFQASSPLVLAEAGRVEQVLLRLLRDAIAVAQDGAELSIADENGGAMYLFSVSAPIDDSRRELLKPGEAKEFFAKGRLGIRAPGESRFDLATCRRLIEAVGGEVSVDQRHDYVGRITLPVAEDQ